jgi:hypothetical protein
LKGLLPRRHNQKEEIEKNIVDLEKRKTEKTDEHKEE